MEDDLLEYEEAKIKVNEARKARSNSKFTPSAFVTPNSVKLRNDSRLEEEFEGELNGNFFTPDMPRVPLNFNQDAEMQFLRSNDYISSLLHNIMQDNDEEL